MAGRVSGYAQLALAIGGMVLTVLFGLRFIFWYVANWTPLHSPELDPMNALGEMWLVMRWAVVGIGLFFVGWLWALATGFQIVLSARKAESATAPPRLNRDQIRSPALTNSGKPPADRGRDKSKGP